MKIVDAIGLTCVIIAACIGYAVFLAPLYIFIKITENPLRLAVALAGVVSILAIYKTFQI